MRNQQNQGPQLPKNENLLLEVDEGVVEAVSGDVVLDDVALHHRPEAAEDELQIFFPRHLTSAGGGAVPMGRSGAARQRRAFSFMFWCRAWRAGPSHRVELGDEELVLWRAEVGVGQVSQHLQHCRARPGFGRRCLFRALLFRLEGLARRTRRKGGL